MTNVNLSILINFNFDSSKHKIKFFFLFFGGGNLSITYHFVVWYLEKMSFLKLYKNIKRNITMEELDE